MVMSDDRKEFRHEGHGVGEISTPTFSWKFLEKPQAPDSGQLVHDRDLNQVHPN